MDRIDTHHHFSPPAYIDAMGADKLFNGAAGSRIACYEWTPQLSLADMDRGGARTAILSIHTHGPLADHPDKARIARECNEYAARLSKDHPDRFGSFATLPMPDVEASLKELAYALDVLKADGVFLSTSYDKRWLGDPAFAPLWDELDRRRAVVYTHPHEPACCVGLIPGVPGSVIEFQTDTTRTIASLIFSGTAARCPNVRVIFSHGGGTMPYLVNRFTKLGETKKMSAQSVLAQLRRFYYDLAQGEDPYPLASLTKLVPATQLLFGTDFPWGSTERLAKALDAYGFDERALAMLNRENALALFPRYSR